MFVLMYQSRVHYVSLFVSGNGTSNDTSLYYGGDWEFGDDFIERYVADIIYVYVSPFLLLLGTIGNLFSLTVMLRLSQQVFSSCVYLAILASVDLVVLYMRCGNDWLKNAVQVDLSNMLMVTSQSICQVYPFVFNFIFHLSKWMLVSLAIEGFIATKYPERVQAMCTLSRAKAVSLLLTVLLVCVNIHYFWSYKLNELKDSEHHNGFLCTFAKHGHQYSEEFQEIIWPILDLLIGEVVPYCVVIACGSIMFVQMVKGKHKGDKQHQQWRKRYQLNSGAMDELKVTVLVVCVFYLLLTMPKFAYIVSRYVIEKYELIEYSFQFDAQQLLAHAVCSTLEYCFLSFKFVIYLSTSTMFRREYCKLFRSLFCHCRNKVYTPADATIAQKPLMAKEHPTIRQQPPQQTMQKKVHDISDWKHCQHLSASLYMRESELPNNVTTV